jgi:hypothetical protein
MADSSFPPVPISQNEVYTIGGGSSSNNVVYPSIGNINGYIYVAIGSNPASRNTNSAQLGYKPLVGASIKAECGATVKTTLSNVNGYYEKNCPQVDVQ